MAQPVGERSADGRDFGEIQTGARQDLTVGNAAKFIAALKSFRDPPDDVSPKQIRRLSASVADGPPPIRHLTVTGTNNRKIDIAPAILNTKLTVRHAGIGCQADGHPHQHYRGRYSRCADLFERRPSSPAGCRITARTGGGVELAEPTTSEAPTRDDRPVRHSREQVNPDPTERVKLAAEQTRCMCTHGRPAVDAKADPTKISAAAAAAYSLRSKPI